MCRCKPETRTYSTNPRTGKKYITCDYCRNWHKRHFAQPSTKARRRAYKKSAAGIAVQKRYESSPKGKITRRVVTVNYNAKRRGNYERITTQDLINLLEKNKAQHGFLACTYCSENVEDGYEIDHDVPLSQDGSNNPKNLNISCASCNYKKYIQTAQEFNGNKSP